MSWEGKTVGLLLAVILAVIAVGQTAPTRTETEEDLVEILQLIRELGESASRLEETLQDQAPQEKEEVPNTETELDQVNEKEIGEKADLQARGRNCYAAWCRNNSPAENNESESESERIDQLLQALTMLKKMKTQDQKRDYDIPFP